MKLLRLTILILSLAVLAPRAQAIPIGNNTELIPGNLEVTGGLKFTNAPTAGFVLTTDVDGNATWQEAPDASVSLAGSTVDSLTLTNSTLGDSITFSSATVGNTSTITFSDSVLQGTVDTGTGLTLTGPFDAALSKLYNDGETDPSAAAALSVDGAGKVSIGGALEVDGAIKFSSGSNDGFVLTSDADGNATWQAIPTASSDFTDASLTGTTTFIAGVGQTDAVVTGDIEFDNSPGGGNNSILKKAVLDVPTITGLLSTEDINVDGTLSVTGLLDVTGTLTADAFDGDGTNIDNVTAVALDAGATVAGSQITGTIDSATVPAAQVSGKVTEAVTADIALALDSGATVPASQIDGDITAQGIDDGADVNLGTTTSDILALDPSADTSVVDAATLTVTNSLMRVQGDAGAVTITNIANGSKDGQILILRGLSDTNTVTVNTGGNLILNSGVRFIIGNRDTISFVFDDAEDIWIETSRADAI